MTRFSVAAEAAYVVLEGHYGHQLDDGQRLTIGDNLAGFFAILHEWDLKAAQGEEIEVKEAPEDGFLQNCIGECGV